MTRSLRFVVCLIGGSCLGQVTATVGPSPAPVDGFISVAIANDTATGFSLPNLCNFQIRDSNNVVIFPYPSCPPFAPYVGPGLVNIIGYVMTGLPPATYFFDVFLPGGVTSTHTVVIDAQVQAGLTTHGPVRIGTSRTVFLDSPGDGGFQYVIGASAPPVSGGIPTCAGLVPLEDDSILALSLMPNPYFSFFWGFLNPTGQGWSPHVTVPNYPNLVGIQFTVAAVILDLSAPCFIRTISAPLLIQIQ